MQTVFPLRACFFRFIGVCLAVASYSIASAEESLPPLEEIPADLVERFAMPNEQRDALIDRAWFKINALMVEPTAEKAAAVEEEFVELRKAANMKAINRFPLDIIYMRLSKPILAPGERRTEKHWKNHLDKLAEWCRLDPKSSAAHIARASALGRYGRTFYNGIQPHLLSEEDWEPIREQCRLAVAELDAVDGLDTLDVHYYVERINNANVLDGDPNQVLAWLKEGIKLAPTSRALYGVTAYYLSPYWHGEWRDVGVFADKVYDHLGGGPTAKLAYFYVVDAVHQIHPSYMHFARYDQKMLREALAVASHFEDIDQRDGRFQVYACEVAWINQDVELARHLCSQWTKLKGYPDPLFKATISLASSGHSELGDRHAFTPTQFQPQDIDYAADGRTVAVASGKARMNPIVWFDAETAQVSSSLKSSPYVNKVCRNFGPKRERTLLCYENPPISAPITFIEDKAGTTIHCDEVETWDLRFAVSPDFSRLAAVSELGGQIFIWDIKTGTKELDFKTVPHVDNLFFTPDSKQLAVNVNSKLTFYDLETKKVALEIEQKSADRDWHYRDAVGYDSQNRLVIQTYERGLSWSFYDLKTQEMKPFARQPFGNLAYRKITADGKHLLYIGQLKDKQQLVVVDLQTGKEIFNREMWNAQTAAAALAPDRKSVAIADGSGLIRFYDAAQTEAEAAPGDQE